MKQSKKKLDDLLDDYLSGKANLKDREMLESSYMKASYRMEFDEDLQSKIGSLNKVGKESWLGLVKRINKKKISIWPRIAIAASFLFVCSLSFLYYFKNDINEPASFVKHDISPGKNGAVLTLSNGKKILINEALDSHIANESGIKISKAKDGVLMYEVMGDRTGASSISSLRTSRGEQIKIRLSDGTLVFLNAGSTLTYPTNFSGNLRREVSLIGEGYFEVAKDKDHPFIVKGKGLDVEVVGTHFNIQNYPFSKQIKATLLEGSVKVSSRVAHTTILKPNQQMVLTSYGAKVREVDVSSEVAWKEGFFMFNNESLEEIMQKISLWYNVEIIYSDTSIKKEAFMGAVSKFENVSKVLNILEKTDVAVFKIEGNKIFVERKKDN